LASNKEVQLKLAKHAERVALYIDKTTRPNCAFKLVHLSFLVPNFNDDRSAWQKIAVQLSGSPDHREWISQTQTDFFEIDWL
jgi:hypothetical protein